VSIQIQQIERMLSDLKIEIHLAPAAQDYLADVGYDPVYGVRPLKRAIQRELQNPIATKILETTFGEGDTIYVDCVEADRDPARIGAGSPGENRVLTFDKRPAKAKKVTEAEVTESIVPEVVGSGTNPEQ
jgi:ATP-dependent Clp protease ATP-binding subunit ClpB